MLFVIVNSREWPSSGPNTAFSISNAHGLARNGIDVHYITAAGSDHDPNHDLQNYYGLPVLKSLHIHPIRHLQLGRMKTRRLFYYRAIKKIQQITHQSTVDMVYSRDPGFLSFMKTLKKKHKTVTCYESHNFFMDLNLFPISRDQLPFMRKYHRLETQYIPHMDAVCCLLGPQAKLYRQHMDPQKVHVMHPGINTAVRPTTPLKDRQTIGYLGGLQGRRGLEIMVAALERCSNQNLKLLIIGGRGAEKEKFLQRTESKSLKQRIDITGWIDYKKLDTNLDQISVGLVPMNDTFYNRNLTAPLKIFDYFARGVPVIAADLDSAREFVDEGKQGLFYHPGDAGDLAAKIETIFSNNRLQTMSEHVFNTATEMTWDKRAQKIIQLVRSIQGS